VSETHNVFVSHRHEDDGKIVDFKDLLKGQNIEIRDSSIDSTNPNSAKDPDYIKTQILAPRIQWAGKIVVIVTPDTLNHQWVDWEVEYANKLGGKQIIGVWAPGANECDLPLALERHADVVVSWNSAKIIAALNGGAQWELPDGTPRGLQPTSRIGC
jgi:hypothetical protein